MAASYAVRRVTELLWGGVRGAARLDAWAVLDGARDARIHRMVRHASVEYACLYAGRLVPALEAAAPYLVRLEPGSALARELMDRGWRASWGIFLSAEASLDLLRRHLRQFLRARAPNGMNMVFRFYDPRVLRVYLATCTPAELQRFFGPVDAFVAPGDDPDILVRYRLVRDRLETTPVDLAPAVALPGRPDGAAPATV